MVPHSVSQIIYKNPILYKVIFALVIGYCIFFGAYITAVGFSLVYVFRYFNFKYEETPHYVGASIGFIGLMLHTEVVWPCVVGLIAVLALKLLKNKSYIFWFEMIAGLPYLYYITQ